MAKAGTNNRQKGKSPLAPKPREGRLKIEAMAPPSSINFMGVKEMKAQMSAVVRDIADAERWIIVTWHGKPRAMLIPFDEEDLEDFILANHPEFIRRREEARREIQAGDYVSHEDLGKSLG